MRKIKIPFVLGFLLVLLPNICISQFQSKTYENTKKLLSKMERSFFDSTLRTLFQKGDERVDDLIQALDEENDDISMNAQMVIRALGNKKGTAALYEGKSKGIRKSSPLYLGSLTPLPMNDAEFQQIDYYLENRNSGYPLMNSLIFALVLDSSEKSEIYFQKFKEIGFYKKDLDVSKARKSFEANGDLAKSVLNNSFFLTQEEKKYSVARVMAYNRSKDKALIYLKRDFGALMEEWFHVVVKKDGNLWSFYSIARTGQS